MKRYRFDPRVFAKNIVMPLQAILGAVTFVLTLAATDNITLILFGTITIALAASYLITSEMVGVTA